MTATFTAMRFDITCRHCGQPLTLTNPGSTAPYESKVIGACTGCRSEWLVAVRMDPVREMVAYPSERKPRVDVPADVTCPVSGVNGWCGSDPAYHKGCREAPCKAAHARAEAERRAKKNRRAA